jgi:hypothetical protein
MSLLGDHDSMAFALMLPQQYGAGFEVATGCGRSGVQGCPGTLESRDQVRKAPVLKYQRASMFLLRSAAACSAV